MQGKIIKTLKSYVLFTVLIILSSNIYADSRYKDLLGASLTVYNQCFPGDTMYSSYPNAMNRVIQGSNSMGYGLEFSLFNWSSLNKEDILSKNKESINWYSYNSSVNSTYRNAQLQELHSAIDANDKNYDKLIFVGAIISLMGDLSLLPESLDSNGIDLKRIYTSLLYDNVLCSEIDMNEQTLEDINKDSAKKIKTLLDQNIQGCQNISWKDFWNKKATDKSIVFGDEGLLKTETGFTCKFEKNDTRYKEFIYQMHLNAINTNFKLLNWSTKNILKRDKKLKF